MSLQTDIDSIRRQEAVLRFVSFDEADAWRLGGLLREMALERGLPLVIDIRIGQRPLFYAALPGTAADNPDWVRRKVNTVMRFLRSSYLVGREYALSGKAFDAGHGIDPMNFANHGGGFPIHIIGTGVVGAVTVSGVPQREDHEFVVAGLAAYLGMDIAQIALPAEE